MLSTLTSFHVTVVDGEGIPVPSVEVGARYRYPSEPRTWSSEFTDGDGCAHFRDDHIEPPSEVCLFVGEQDCGTELLVDGAQFVLEM